MSHLDIQEVSSPTFFRFIEDDVNYTTKKEKEISGFTFSWSLETFTVKETRYFIAVGDR